MMLADRLSEYIRACFSGLWVQSAEHEDALAEIAQLCRSEQWQLAAWDIESGLTLPGQADLGDTAGTDPLAAIRSLQALVTPAGTAILVLKNFHRYLQSAEVVQCLAQQIVRGKQDRAFILILSPVVQFPPELEKLFVVVNHDLPDRAQLEEIARGVATQEGELPEGLELAQVLDAAAGLTRFEAEGAYALSLVREGKITPEALWSLKAQQLMKSGLLQLHRGTQSFNSLGGLDSLKSFCLRAMRRQQHADPLRRPRGVMLLSPPGCGKSEFAKTLGNETGRPTLTLDVGSLMSSLVGSTEANVRKALQVIDVMSPCVVLIDEVEKALAGVAGSGQNDSGVSSRLFGTLLSWMNDRTGDAFLIATCNDVSKLPPEFSRAERFDGIFFVDLPSEAERQSIWEIYLHLFQLDAGQERPADTNWTGAEIRSCCRLSALLDVPLLAAAQNVVPVAVTASESVDRLRQWASGRCLSAAAAGVYQYQPTTPVARRRVRRDPSQN